MGFKNVSVIIDGRLFLGKSVFHLLESLAESHTLLFSLVSAQSTRSLTERRITHIVSVCTEQIPAEHPQSGIRHMRVPVHDAHHEDLLIWMPHTCRFIDEALHAGGVVLVHGVHGLSRGATIMAAYCTIPQLLYLHDLLSHDYSSDVVKTGRRCRSFGHCQTK
jgi:dual specificity phosphatase 12